MRASTWPGFPLSPRLTSRCSSLPAPGRPAAIRCAPHLGPRLVWTARAADATTTVRTARKGSGWAGNLPQAARMAAASRTSTILKLCIARPCRLRTAAARREALKINDRPVMYSALAGGVKPRNPRLRLLRRERRPLRELSRRFVAVPATAAARRGGAVSLLPALDDIADEGDANATTRRQLLADYRADLAGCMPASPRAALARARVCRRGAGAASPRPIPC